MNRLVRRSLFRFQLSHLAFVVLLITTSAIAQQPAKRQTIAFLEQRVQEQPDNASYWRLLGRAYAQQGEHRQAIDALDRAIQLNARSAAAHCDLAMSLMALGESQKAADSFARTTQLAPDSEYAATALRHLPQLPEPQLFDDVELASYEIKRFERNDRFPDLSVDPESEGPPVPTPPFTARFESGVMFNSNITLTPTSRGLSSNDASSFQGVLNADLDYVVLNGELWRLGPSLDGYFNMNEGPFQDLNLQSYQPGFFVERSVYTDTTILIPRVHYTYTLDQFSGDTFANRHAVNTTLSGLWDSGATTSTYWTIDYTNFAEDGVTQSIDSRDGWTNIVGMNHIWAEPAPWVQAFLLGTELQFADTDGSSFAYRGVSIYSEASVPIGETVKLILEGGWGYRDYYRFEFTPSRNENIWSAGLRVTKSLSEAWSIVGVMRFDDFDSKNSDFAANRYVTGILTVFGY